MALVTRTESALEVTNHALWPDFATDQQRGLAESAQRFVEGSAKLVGHANERFVEAELNQYATFFDSVESQPLTISQRRACVISEDNNLVLAGAGTGKTSTIIGRAGHLLASGQVQPPQLLMLAYGRKAAGEMQERQDTRLAPWLDGGSPKIKTFHALGLEIIGKAEGKHPDVSPMAEDSRAYQLRLRRESCDAETVPPPPARRADPEPRTAQRPPRGAAAARGAPDSGAERDTCTAERVLSANLEEEAHNDKEDGRGTPLCVGGAGTPSPRNTQVPISSIVRLRQRRVVQERFSTDMTVPVAQARRNRLLREQ
jgi:hypothetical protein